MIAGLQPSVAAGLPGIFGKWEGAGLGFFYTDSKGLVTIGTGNLVDPVIRAMSLPMRLPDGSLASGSQIAAAWNAVKAAWPGVQSTRCAALTNLRLDAAGRASLVLKTVATDWALLVAEFPDCVQWPADAQLALLSLAWAWGAGFPAVWNRISAGSGDKFRSLLGTPPEFPLASQLMRDVSQGHAPGWDGDPDAPVGGEEKRNPGIIPRDEGMMVMFSNAASVAADGADYSKLWFPEAYAAAA